MMNMTYTAGRGVRLMIAGLLMLLDCLLDGVWRCVKGLAGLLWHFKLQILAIVAAAAVGAAVPPLLVTVMWAVI